MRKAEMKAECEEIRHPDLGKEGFRLHEHCIFQSFLLY